MKQITITLDLDYDEYEELMENELVQGDLNSFLFALLCQDYSMGILTALNVEDVAE